MSINRFFVSFEKIADSLMEESIDSEKDDNESSDDKKSEIFEKTVEFIKDKENLSDSELHNWAESEGFDTFEVEELMYFLAYNFVHLLHSGKAYDSGTTEEDVDADELAQGIKVEMEHTDDEFLAKKIALDHLSELGDYYTRLKKMEGTK